MAKIRIDDIFRPLAEEDTQAYFGRGLHTLGLLKFLLKQTGPADIYISTFSTSDAFLRGYYLLRQKTTIRHSVMLTDFKASRKTINLYKMMRSCFDEVYMGMNHSKVVLITNDKFNVSVVTSQNQTYGDRCESTVVTTKKGVFVSLYKGFSDTVNYNSIKIDDYNRGSTQQDNRFKQRPDTDIGDIDPFAY
jgi:hypothetical protein